MADYTSSFKTLKGDTIRLTISGASGGGELTLDGQSPVTIEYDVDDVFSSLKTSTCSVCVVTDEPLLGLYTGELTDISLKVWRTAPEEGASEELLWFGFMSPNVFSMPYDSKNNQLTLEFVDPLSAMDDVRFRRWDDMFYATFEEYVERALEKVNANSVISISTDAVTTAAFADGIGCLQRNYIDETNDEDDGSMTWKEVLESIFQYMNKTAYIWKGKLFVYDTLDTSRSAVDMATLGIAGGDGTISLGETYNKVTIVASNNPAESAIPDVLEEEDFVAQEEDPQFYKTEYFADQTTYGERSCMHDVDDDYTRYYLMNAAFTSKKWDLSTSYVTKLYDVGLYDDQVGLDEPPTTGSASKVPFGSMLTYAVAPGTWVGVTPYYSLQTKHIMGSFIQRYCSVEKKVVTSSLSWEKCLTLAGEGAKATIKSDYMPTFVGQGGYLILSMKYKMSYWAYPQSVIQGFEIATEKDGVEYPLALSCMLKIGEMYWNGTEWTETESTFNVKNTPDDGVYTTNNEVSIDNEVSWNLGLNNSSEGALIPLPTDKVMSGKIYFAVTNPNLQETHMPPSYYHITEMALQYATASTIEDIFDMEEYDADIIYTGTIHADNVEEMDDIEFKTNTYTDRAVSYSYVMKKSTSGEYSYVVPDDDELCAERVCLQRVVRYYRKPKITYNISLNDYSSSYLSPADNITVNGMGTFTVGSITFDLVDNSAEVTMLQIS